MKIFNVFLFCFFLVSYSFSQAPEIEWQNTIGGNATDFATFGHQTSDGGYILAGSSFSPISADKTENIFGVCYCSDYWVIKTNSESIIEWQNNIGGASLDYLNSIQQTSDGGYILGGYSNSNISGDKSEKTIGPGDYYDYWIIKLNASGIIEWQNTIGGNLDDYLITIQETFDGGFIAGGYSYSGEGFDKTEPNIGGVDYWLIKLNAFGSIEWQNTIGGIGDDYLHGVNQTSDGGFIIAGNSNSEISGDKTEYSLGTDYWVVKLNSSGTIEWQNTIGGNAGDLLYSIVQTEDGGYILGGYSNSEISGDKTEGVIGPSAFYDYWIIKITSIGNIEWQNTIGGNADDELFAIHKTTDGGYIIGGSSKSGLTGDKTEANLGGRDYWIIKLFADGTIEWQNTIGGNNDDYFSSLQQTVDGGFFIVGSSSSASTGDKTETCILGSSDYWIIKLFPELLCVSPDAIYTDNITTTSAKIHWNTIIGATKYQINYRPIGGGSWLKKNSTMTFKNITGLVPNTTYEYKIKTICTDESSEFSPLFNFTTLPLKAGESNDQFIIYPNPSSTTITVQTNNINAKTINIFDAVGQGVYSNYTNDSLVIINIDHLPSGIYFVKVESEMMTTTEKIIIE